MYQKRYKKSLTSPFPFVLQISGFALGPRTFYNAGVDAVKLAIFRDTVTTALKEALLATMEVLLS